MRDKIGTALIRLGKRIRPADDPKLTVKVVTTGKFVRSEEFKRAMRRAGGAA